MSSRRRSVFAKRLVNSAPDGAPRVLDDLRAAIVSGSEPPGTLIPIDDVAHFFGVSQIPVREALKLLLGEGLVEHVPHVGYSVAKLTFDEFRELYEVRRALEVAALRAAVRRAGPRDDELARERHDAMRLAMLAQDERSYHEASRGFHLALIAPSGMVRLRHQYESAWNLTEPARPMAHVPVQGREVFYADHQSLLEAFLARDGETLLAHCDTHYEHLFAGIQVFADDPDVFTVP